MTSITPPVCAFCGVSADPKDVFNTNTASGMSASLRTSGEGREVMFGYGSEFDGDVFSLGDGVEINPGIFSACDDCGTKMIGDGRLKLTGNYLTGEAP